MKADINLPRALLKLPKDSDLTEEVKDELAKFEVHVQRVFLLPVLLCKQLVESNKLPSTLDALNEHFNCVGL